jgi:hypothetical protein
MPLLLALFRFCVKMRITNRLAAPNKSEPAFGGNLSALWALLSLQGSTLLRLPPPKSHKIFRPKGQKNFARTDLGWGKTQNAVKPSGLTSILTQPHRKYAEQNRVRIDWVRLASLK